MKAILTIGLLWGLFAGSASAQKAFEAIEYKGSIEARKFHLTLGNGYLGASKIKLLQKGEKLILYYPDSGVPDDKAQLSFHAKDRSDYFILNNMQELYAQPPKNQVGRYWSGKTWFAVKFVLVR